MLKEIVNNDSVNEVTLDRKYNDSAIKASLKVLRSKMKDIEKKLKKIEAGNFDDDTANKVRGDLNVVQSNFYVSLPIV